MTFKPHAKAKKTYRHIQYRCDASRYAELQTIADAHKITLKELLRQMVDFSLQEYPWK